MNLIEKWNKTGLLNNSTDERKKILANKLEDLYLYLSFRKNHNKILDLEREQFFAKTILIILVRVSDLCPENKTLPDACWLINDYEEYLSENEYYPVSSELEFAGIEGGVDGMIFLCEKYAEKVATQENYE